MIHFELGIRYLSQLKRIRPDELGRFEAAVSAALDGAGGVLRREGEVFRASFDEGALAFWLDLAIALEGISAALEALRPDLLGRSCVVRSDDRPSADGPSLRDLAARDGATGIWCDAAVAAALGEYGDFRADSGLFALDSFSFRASLPGALPDFLVRPRLVEKLRELFASDGNGRVRCALEGPDWSGSAQSARECFRESLGAGSSLWVRFDGRLRGLASVADALSPLVDAAGEEPGPFVDGRPAADIVASVAADRFSLESSAAKREAFLRAAVALADRGLLRAESGESVPDSDGRRCILVENVHLADPRARAFLKDFLSAPRVSETFDVLLCGNGDEAIAETCPSPYRILRVDLPGHEELRRSFPGLKSRKDAVLPRDWGISGAYRSSVGWSLAEDGSVRAAPGRLSGDLLEFAYALELSRGLCPEGELAAFTFRGLKPESTLALALQRLSELGVLESAALPLPAMLGFAEYAAKVLGRRGDAVRALVRRRFSEAMGGGRLRASFESLEAYAALGGEANDAFVLDAVVGGALRGECSAVESALAEGRLASDVGALRAPALDRLFRSRSALLWGDEAEVRAAFDRPELPSYPGPRYRAYSILDDASYALCRAEKDGTLSVAAAAVKEALMMLQDLPDVGGLARSYRLLGEIELCRERIAEATDYFAFSAESAERSGDAYESLFAEANAAATQFLFGNYSRALRAAAEAERLGLLLYQAEWTRWAAFMRGRVLFEVGKYQGAGAAFEALSVEPGSEAAATVDAWLCRSRIYAAASDISALNPDSVRVPPDAPAGDAALVAIEAAYLGGDYPRAVSLADAMLAVPRKPRFRSPERVDWSSGFALVEDRSVGGASSDGVARRLVRAYRALSLAAGADPVSAVAELRRLTKDEKVSEYDPYDAFYFRALYLAQCAAGTETVDRGTILSMAFKRLQRRASRIDDAEARRSYVSDNRWNASLYSDAKASKLI